MLRDLDIDLRIVEDGRAAVEAYEDFRPDLVLTDISMPRMDGITAARAMRDLAGARGWGPVPILAMTAHSSGDLAELAGAEVIDRQLTKPLRKGLLVDAISAVAADGIRPPLRPQAASA